ncbi:hypothetical protein PAXRUDRAFT_826010 [Paxillus rubicundulus Ve08.2h10]|uniref:Uncharacterized protein n=1 Tax=Paxillus rubicundulus Ve08.2h10 TaxID=930991 RepID=A0A0D0DFD8_9AGAM|nr:hypothetical protein PAXRUDRAFT_826010 [Paxillus rubicundulus Ve08.2h10]
MLGDAALGLHGLSMLCHSGHPCLCLKTTCTSFKKTGSLSGSPFSLKHGSKGL